MFQYPPPQKKLHPKPPPPPIYNISVFLIQGSFQSVFFPCQKLLSSSNHAVPAVISGIINNFLSYKLKLGWLHCITRKHTIWELLFNSQILNLIKDSLIRQQKRCSIPEIDSTFSNIFSSFSYEISCFESLLELLLIGLIDRVEMFI